MNEKSFKVITKVSVTSQDDVNQHYQPPLSNSRHLNSTRHHVQGQTLGADPDLGDQLAAGQPSPGRGPLHVNPNNTIFTRSFHS